MAIIDLVTKGDLIEFRKELLKDLQALMEKEDLPSKKWLKTDEVRKLLKVSAGTLQTLRINGTITYTKLGGILYYDYEQIERLMMDNLREARK